MVNSAKLHPLISSDRSNFSNFKHALSRFQSTAREVKPSEGSQQHATGIRPDSLNMHNKPNRVDGRTPSVDTQPIPIFVPQKSDGTKPTYDEDVEGFKVNISNTAQLSPDSVDKDNTTSEDQGWLSIVQADARLSFLARK